MLVARVRRSLVATFAVLGGVSLAASVVSMAVGGIAEGDERAVAGLLAVLGVLVLACVVGMLRARIVVTEDGRLVGGALRRREVDLTRLDALHTSTERPQLAPPRLVLQDELGATVRFTTGAVYDRERGVLGRVIEAAEAREVPLSGLARNLLSQAAQRPVGEAQARHRRAAGRVQARRQRVRLVALAGVSLLMIVLPLSPLLGGALTADTPQWVQPTGLAAVGAAVVLWGAVVTRELRRRLTIDAAGRLCADRLLGDHHLDLAALRAVRLAPDKPYYEHNQHAPPAGRIPRLVLTDTNGRELRLRADDYWHPAHPIFARILDAATDAGLHLTEHADYTLRYLAGRAEPAWQTEAAAHCRVHNRD